MNIFLKLGVGLVSTIFAWLSIQQGFIDFENLPVVAGLAFAAMLAAVVIWIDLGVRFLKLCKRHPIIAFFTGVGGSALAAMAFGERVELSLKQVFTNGGNAGPLDVVIIFVALLMIVGIGIGLLAVVRNGNGKKGGPADDDSARHSENGRVVEFPGRDDEDSDQQKASNA